MSGGDASQDADFEQASSQLSEGLRSCRSLVANYRAILTHEPAANDDDAGDMSRYVSTTDATAANDPGGSAE